MSLLHLPIAREGWPFVGAGMLAFALTLLFSSRAAALALASTAALAFFFRDPARPLERQPDLLYAPSDGRVITIERTESAELGGPAWRIAVFLSLADVHVNRSPASGVVTRVAYRPGRLARASNPGVEHSNERNELTLATERGPLQVVQIAGLVARRIVCRPGPGAQLRSGERIGIIMFSSRTDLLLPCALAEPLARPGQRVWGGVTPLAAWFPWRCSPCCPC